MGNLIYLGVDDEKIEDESLERMSAKEVFEKIGPERVKELTKLFNQKVIEEYEEARKKKDQVLVDEGLVKEEDLHYENTKEK